MHSAQQCTTGWSAILAQLKSKLSGRGILVIECYHGVNEGELEKALAAVFKADSMINAQQAYKSASEIDALTFPDVTDDRIFGFRTRLNIEAFFDDKKVTSLRAQIDQKNSEIVVLYGTGASHLVSDPDVLVYADMARWEIQQRMRRGEVSNLGVKNCDLEIARKYKRAYFVDWQICDRLKKKTIDHWHYLLDTNQPDHPKMISIEVFQTAMEQAVNQPFRVVPFFDPGPWGGQWMREVCDLDKEPANFAWCFDCVPEENSVQFQFGETTMELPASNLVFFRPKQLLGAGVYARFGDEFPIRFDFLDTMDGGNLSLQVHPLTEYIQEHFGMHYTQDESYYMLDAGQDAIVYLGLKEDVNPDLMIQELKAAQQEGQFFDAEKHVENWPAKKHDHFLIPAGTVHCSCTNSMVLEISATPYIFTFKLWDWGRLGMDGLPRPINIERGEKSIQWDRRTEWTKKNLINRFEYLEEGDGWRAEKTGLHETEFIETVRHWFTKKVHHDTRGNLNVLNLVQGREAIVESPAGNFEPFVVHYAETFIIPANVGAYTIRPYGEGSQEECATIKAFVKY
ncbi:MAG: mannose-6-phosphate isomerase [Saprospiraceae bacterium]|nr:MAG: mannose-6-phosphate isomerase [Saprospiraceae bacterium]